MWLNDTRKKTNELNMVVTDLISLFHHVDTQIWLSEKEKE